MAAVKTQMEKEKMELEDYGAPENFTFDPVQHLYTLDGKPLQGVTTVLGVIAKPMLIQWAANMACDYIQTNADKVDIEAGFNLDVWEKLIKEARTAHRKKKEKAGELGTEVHADIEVLIKKAIAHNKGRITTAHLESDKEQVKNFVKWAIENNVEFLASEQRMFSREMWTAGTADIICKIDGKLYVGDVKTSSGIYAEHFIQASAYAAMLTEIGAYKDFHGVIILNCRKDGGFEHKYNFDLEGNLKCFKSALTLYRHLNAISGK